MSQVKYIDSAGLRKFSQLLAAKIVAELATKVDAVSGKQLSTEDFTAALKTKLEGINIDNLLSAADKAKIHEHSNKGILDTITQAVVDAWSAADENVIETVKVNGTAQTVTNKEINIAVPTRVSDLNNDSGFQNATQVANAITAAVGSITGIDFTVVQSLPATGVKGIIYLLAATGGADPDVYDEYIWLDGENDNPGRFEKIGTTETKFSNYWSKTELTFATLSDAEVTTVFDDVFNPSQSQGE